MFIIDIMISENEDKNSKRDDIERDEGDERGESVDMFGWEYGFFEVIIKFAKIGFDRNGLIVMYLVYFFIFLDKFC